LSELEISLWRRAGLTGWSDSRRLSRFADVGEDPLDLRWVKDEGEYPYRLSTARTRERQTFVDPRLQERPAAGSDAADRAALFACVGREQAFAGVTVSRSPIFSAAVCGTCSVAPAGPKDAVEADAPRELGFY
jgi:hypothetical protein